MEHYWLLVGRVLKTGSNEVLRVVVLRDDGVRDEIAMGAFRSSFIKKNPVLNVTADSRGLHGKGVNVREMPRYNGQKGHLHCIGAEISEQQIIHVAKPYVDKFKAAQRRSQSAPQKEGEYKYLTKEYCEAKDKQSDAAVDGMIDVGTGTVKGLTGQYVGGAVDGAKGFVKLNNQKYYYKPQADKEYKRIAESLNEEEKKELAKEALDYNMQSLNRAVTETPERKAGAIKGILKTAGNLVGGSGNSDKKDSGGLNVIEDDGKGFTLLEDKKGGTDASCLLIDD